MQTFTLAIYSSVFLYYLVISLQSFKQITYCTFYVIWAQKLVFNFKRLVSQVNVEQTPCRHII